MITTGLCELCKTSGKLCRSHVFLPKFVYKRLISAKAKNPNPVTITSNGVCQTSHQYWRYLLCGQCENDRFNKLGEKWVASACLQTDGSFPLLGMLSKAPVYSDEKSAFYQTDNVCLIDHAALEYFAASMLWRSQFDNHSQSSVVRLGPYDIYFRDYLLKKTPFPIDASLLICVRYRSNINQLSHGVTASRIRLAHAYRFSIPGMNFFITVGRDRGQEHRNTCFAHEPGKLIFEGDSINDLHNLELRRIKQIAHDAGKSWLLKS